MAWSIRSSWLFKYLSTMNTKPLSGSSSIRNGMTGSAITCAMATTRNPEIIAPVSEAARSGDHTSWLVRSEEHTSELQSLMRISYAVFCLQQQKYNYHHLIREK